MKYQALLCMRAIIFFPFKGEKRSQALHTRKKREKESSQKRVFKSYSSDSYMPVALPFVGHFFFFFLFLCYDENHMHEIYSKRIMFSLFLLQDSTELRFIPFAFPTFRPRYC